MTERLNLRRGIRRLKTLPVLPTLLTAGNLASGITAVLFAANEQFFYGAVMVFVAMICDMLDGKVARMTGQEGAFGAELDSLSDVVSFGVAPAILMHRLVLGQPAVFDHGERLLWFCAVFFPVMAAIRLARYNVEHSDAPTPWFRGLPSPGAAAVVCGWIILHQQSEGFRTLLGSAAQMDARNYHGLSDLDAFRWLLIVVTFISALTMVSTIRFPHIGNLLFGRMAYRKLIGVLLAVVVFSLQPAISLVVATTGYQLLGLSLGLIDAVRRLRAGRNPLDDDDDDDSEDAGLTPANPEDRGPAAGR